LYFAINHLKQINYRKRRVPPRVDSPIENTKTRTHSSMRGTSLLFVVAALCMGLGGSPATADARADAPGIAPLDVDQAHLRGLREEAGQASESVKDAALADNGDNPLKPPSAPALHRVYDPLTGLTCDLVSECLACAVTERDAAYCRETGFRQELDCPRPQEGEPDPAAAPRETRYRACVPPERVVPAVAVFKFEVSMRR
jgi:hypothetical protein